MGLLLAILLLIYFIHSSTRTHSETWKVHVILFRKDEQKRNMDLIKFDGIKMSSVFVSCYRAFYRRRHKENARKSCSYLFIYSIFVRCCAPFAYWRCVDYWQSFWNIHTNAHTKYIQSRTEIGACSTPTTTGEKNSCYRKFSIAFRCCTNFMLAHIKYNWIWIGWIGCFE